MIELGLSVDVFRLVLACAAVMLLVCVLMLFAWVGLEFKIVRRQWDYHDGKWNEIN